MRLQFLISVLLFIATHAFGQQSEVRNFIGASLDSRLDPAKHQISHEYGNFSTINALLTTCLNSEFNDKNLAIVELFFSNNNFS